MSGLGKLLTIVEAAQVLKLEVSTLRKMVYRREIGTVRLKRGRSRGAVRFPEKEVLRLINESYVPAIEITQ